MKACLYCCNTPVELVESFGIETTRFVSSGLTSDESKGELHPGLCSWCKTVVGCENVFDILIASRTCDQMIRSLDFKRMGQNQKLLVTHMPATRTKESFKYFRNELLWLIDRLSEITKNSFDKHKLEKSIKKWNKIRKDLREIRGSLSCSVFSKLVHKIMDGKAEILKSIDTPQNTQNQKIKRIALAGCPTSKSEITFLKMIEKNGVSIVFDATCTGDRFNELEVKESGDLIENLAGAYFDRIPCIRARPNTEVFDWMMTKITELGVDGIVWKTLRGCDMWTAELEKAKDILGVPVLGIDISYSDITSPRIQTRIEAFLEGLS